MNARALTRVLMAVVLCAALPLTAQTVSTGELPSGGFYHIQVPDGWTPASGLVIWNHGFDLSPPGPEPDLGPLGALQLQEGYAVAASSYSLNGWALFETATNNQELVQQFESEFGVPDTILVTGASLGGIVTARDIESGLLGNVVGAMPICGALGGSKIWHGAFDLRLLYDYVCSEVPGAAIPGGPTGLPFPPDPSFDELALVGAVTACTGVALPPELRSAEQKERLATYLELTGIPENFVLTDLGFATFGMQDLIFDPAKLNGAMPFSNAHVDYGDDQVNAGIQRVEADPQALDYFLDNYSPTGKVMGTKIVSIHTDKDGLVLVENETDYASVVPPGRLTVGIVVEDSPTHCGFTEAEVVAAWESLRGWVAGTPKPTAQSLQATCQALELGGLAAGPCRIDPGFVLPPLSDRVRDRETCVADGDTVCLLKDRFRVEIAWEDFHGETGPGRVVNQSSDSATLYFFRPDNWEMTVKVLDGRPVNGHFWVFYGSLTNVGFELTVTDTVTGQVKTYENPVGDFASRGDTEAF